MPPRSKSIDGALVTFALAITTCGLAASRTVSTAPGAAAIGGFIEKAGSSALRPRFTRAQIDAFLPANGARGAFTFPAPYNTHGVRLTKASDCAGQDCVWYAGYSYWRNINNHVGSPWMLIFLGMDRNHGGAGPSLLAG